MNTTETYYNQLLIEISNITGFINLISVAVITFFYLKHGKSLFIIYWYLVIRLFLEILTKLFIWSTDKHFEVFWKPILAYFNVYDTNFFNGFYYLVHILFVGLFFIKILKFYNKKLVTYIIIGLSIFQVYNYLFIDGFRNYGILGVTLSDILLIILPCIYLYQMSNNPPSISVQQNSYFWISLALFIPHLLQLAITITANDLHKTNFVLFCKTHFVRNIILIFSQLLFLIAFIKSKYLKFL